MAYRERPGAVVWGGFRGCSIGGIRSSCRPSKYELPATAAQLQAVHRFTEELTQVTGGVSLYNEALGTTSDVYHYDRVKGREAAGTATAVRPWDSGRRADRRALILPDEDGLLRSWEMNAQDDRSVGAPRCSERRAFRAILSIVAAVVITVLGGAVQDYRAGWWI